MRHLVKGHIWNAIDGRVAIFERMFATFEEAKQFAPKKTANVRKSATKKTAA